MNERQSLLMIPEAYLHKYQSLYIANITNYFPNVYVILEVSCYASYASMMSQTVCATALQDYNI